MAIGDTTRVTAPTHWRKALCQALDDCDPPERPKVRAFWTKLTANNWCITCHLRELGNGLSEYLAYRI